MFVDIFRNGDFATAKMKEATVPADCTVEEMDADVEQVNTHAN